MLLIALIPALRVAGLPLRFPWKSIISIYWGGFTAQSILTAVVLYAIEFPFEMWKKLTSRFNANEDPRESLRAIIIPAAYFFVVLFLVCSYNDVIAVLRFDGSADLALNRMDASLLGGVTVASMAQGLSANAISFLRQVYTLLFSLVGGCMVMLALRYGRSTAMSFISTIATVYYIALIVFYFVPATGPYYPADISHPYVQVLNALVDRRAPKMIGTDYFIALPCLHIAQPLIALWFVRKWKKIATVLAAYCVAVIPTVILLQEHYVVDIVAGVFVAIIVIAMMSMRMPVQHSSEASRLP